jgi:hypothetical protein
VQRFGFSVKGLLAAVTAAAVGVAALVNATQFWVRVIGLLTALILLTAIVAAICCSRRRRGFWIGCSVFAWGYFVLAAIPDEPPQLSRVTDSILYWLYESLASDVDAASPGPARPTITTPGGIAAPPYQITVDQTPDWGAFQPIGQCLWIWLFAAVGGFVGTYFYARRERNP